MKFIQAILIPLALSLVASCGGGSDSIADEMSDTTGAFISTLKSIDSPESAKAAEPKLSELVEDMKAFAAKMAKLTPEERAEIEAATEEGKMAKQEDEMKAEMMRLMTRPEIAAALLPIFEKMTAE